jgi:phytanoyl-CoA hydroxylase
MLTSKQLRQYEDLGYVVVPDLIPEQVVAEVLRDCMEIAKGLVRDVLSDDGDAEDMREASLDRQVIELTKRTGRSMAQHFDISFPVRGEFGPWVPINLRPGMFAFLTCPQLLDAVQDITGPEIFCNPTQHLRMKLPKDAVPAKGAGFLTATVPWHQDQGVIAAEADESHILTVWSPLNPANRSNGCLAVMPGSHRQHLLDHCFQAQSNQYGIPARVVDSLGQAAVLEMEPGSVLLMHQRTVHASLENSTTDQLRISFDLRYQPVGEPTGRPLFDGFVARSREAPASAVTSWAEWARIWEDTRRRLPPELDPAEFFRWGPGDVCA